MNLEARIDASEALLSASMTVKSVEMSAVEILMDSRKLANLSRATDQIGWGMRGAFVAAVPSWRFLKEEPMSEAPSSHTHGSGKLGFQSWGAEP